MVSVVNKHTPGGFNNFLVHPDQRMVVLICDSGAANGIPGIGTEPGVPVEFVQEVIIIRVNDGEFEF